MNIELSTILPQLGLSVIFAYAAFVLYKDMREDSKAREDKLLTHLDKVADTLSNINHQQQEMANTLETMNERLQVVENCVRGGHDNETH